MRSRLINRCAELTVLVAILATGCNNRPNALQMTLTTSKQVYHQDEAVRLTATFASTDGSVCINKPWAKFLHVELRNLESNQQLEQMHLGFCGTPYVGFAPLMPFMYAGAFLDVANIGGRFVVIEEDQPRDFSYALRGNGDRFIIRSDSETQSRVSLRQIPLLAGRYRLKVNLKSELQRGTIVPLFWSLYDETASATTEFEIMATKTDKSES